jgi:uncharacterized repeat protein (TIGR04076 family)
LTGKGGSDIRRLLRYETQEVRMTGKVKRREFCSAVPAAALGALVCPWFSGNSSAQEERKMEKRVRYVEVRVAEVKGTCGASKVGDTARVTDRGVEGKICIHALYSMLPAVFAMMYGARFPWLSNPDKKTHACPDAANPVVFEITRVWEG